MEDHRVAPDARPELLDLVGGLRRGMDDRRVDGQPRLLQGGQQAGRVQVDGDAEVRVLERAVHPEMLASGPLLHVDEVHAKVS
ncbi:hypothetical protein D3C87_2113210 [compost metagenome]